jgi:hypothetical protein
MLLVFQPRSTFQRSIDVCKSLTSSEHSNFYLNPLALLKGTIKGALISFDRLFALFFISISNLFIRHRLLFLSITTYDSIVCFCFFLTPSPPLPPSPSAPQPRRSDSVATNYIPRGFKTILKRLLTKLWYIYACVDYSMLFITLRLWHSKR